MRNKPIPAATFKALFNDFISLSLISSLRRLCGVRWGRPPLISTVELIRCLVFHLLDVPLPHSATQVAGLFWQPSFLEILPMYSPFLLFAPAVTAQLDGKRHWLVIGASVLLWIADQFGLRARLLDTAGLQAAHLGYFNFFAWQVLFVSGMICGHQTYRVNRPWLPRNGALPLAAYVLAVFFFMWHHQVLEIPLSRWWIQRSSLGPLRLLNFACLAFLAARFRGPIARLIGWRGLAFLSRHSLQVFAFHLIPIYAAALVIEGRMQLAWWAQLLFLGVCVLGLFYMAWVSRMATSRLRSLVISQRSVPTTPHRRS